MTKEEMYAGVVKVHKATAQGVPGSFIQHASAAAYTHLQELVADGRLKCVTDSNDEWFFPTTGYSIWNAETSEQQYMDMLCARYHLDMLEPYGRIEPSREEFEAREDYMLMYRTWYELHKDELEVLATLSETY
jgi:hypothetical protein